MKLRDMRFRDAEAQSNRLMVTAIVIGFAVLAVLKAINWWSGK